MISLLRNTLITSLSLTEGVGGRHDSKIQRSPECSSMRFGKSSKLQLSDPLIEDFDRK